VLKAIVLKAASPEIVESVKVAGLIARSASTSPSTGMSNTVLLDYAAQMKLSAASP
jgi:hypothetical protein